MFSESISPLLARVNQARIVRGATLDDLARSIGCAPSTLRKIVAGHAQPKDELIDSIAEGLGVHAEWLRLGKGQVFTAATKLAVVRIYASIDALKTRAGALREEIEIRQKEIKEIEATVASLEGLAPQAWADLRASGLTNVTPESITAEMQPSTLPSLIERLNELTSVRGKKAQLAAFMDVPMPRVWEWLSGKKKPGGETTLRLLQWVEQQEAQHQSGPGSVQPPPEPKAQSVRRSRHEDQNKPGPEQPCSGGH
jgi:transcriptional regulator with XRE-family HTH domain